MGRFAALVLGVITSIGGFLDIGELVAMPQAGATFQFALLWVLALGTIGAMCFAETAGRIQIASGRTVFDLIRERMGPRAGLVPLTAGLLVNVFTLVAEIGGMAFVLELIFGVGFIWLVVPAAVALLVLQVKGNWKLLENLPSFLGLAMLVVPAALIWGDVNVPWRETGREVVAPNLPVQDHVLYLTTAIAVLGAALAPYEWYFYSSGAREERWGRRDLVVDRVTAIAGFGLGSLLAAGLMIGAAVLFFPNDIDPVHLSQTGLIAVSGFAKWGLALFIVGAFGCVLGAAIEVSQSTGQAVAQFFGWPWGASKRPREVPGFTAVYVAVVVIATAVLLAGFDPIKVTVLALIFGVMALPFTFFPMLIVANDPVYMGDLTNGLLANALGWFFLLLISIAGIAAIPLIVVTGGAI